MNKIKLFHLHYPCVLGLALLHWNAFGQASVSVEIGLPAVEIHAESDFYEPLAPEGEWIEVGSYGRCWRPSHVDHDWRPYTNGNWERTDEGWYWVSDEPWGWATYHYGRWDFNDDFGWYWVPQTQWAPAWVSWHEGGGYVGWAPLQPSVSISINGFVGFDERRISPRAYVFVEQRHFTERVRPTTIVINNTTVINRTRTMRNSRMVNNNVINDGPGTGDIEKASGRKIASRPVRELRHQQEAAVSNRKHQENANDEKKQKSAGPEATLGEKKNEKAKTEMKTPEKAQEPTEPKKEQPRSHQKKTTEPMEPSEKQNPQDQRQDRQIQQNPPDQSNKQNQLPRENETRPRQQKERSAQPTSRPEKQEARQEKKNSKPPQEQKEPKQGEAKDHEKRDHAQKSKD
jgi:hypothetical protein